MLLLPLGAALALHVAVQVGDPPQRSKAAFVRDSSIADSTTRNARRRLPVTAEVLATAFRDERAKELFYRARTARMAQDSSLRSYDAKVRARISVGLGIGERGRERMFYRQESASRVRWQQGVGARVELTGARIALPIAPAKDERNEFLANLVDGDLVSIPYFPGYEALWIGERTAQADVDERRLVNPLAQGAEAYYTYESGDSIRYTLPDRSTVNLREIKVRPRSPKWNLAVGSLTFDIASGQLVQAVYRLAAPIDEWAQVAERADTNRNARKAATIGKAILSPYRSEVSEVAIEYSLYEGRFWLPRSRTMKGQIRIAFARLPATIEHAFRYTSVNGGDTLPAIVTNTPDYLAPVRTPDSLSGEAARRWRDSAQKANRVARDAVRDSLDTGPCDSTGTRTLARTRYEGQLAVAVTFPCNVDKLIDSPDLPASIFDPDEEVFGSADRDELIKRALPLAAQAGLSLGGLSAPRLQYGLSMTRYNRVEGLSSGLLVEQQLGGGYAVTAAARLGLADLEPNGELSIARTNLTRTVTLTGYNRLVSAGDWGRPLSFGSSVSAFLFGRDDGFYYRASGAELGWTSNRGLKLDWRLFAEQQRTARQRTAYSVAGGFGPNIVATTGVSAGAAVRLAHTHGLDPRGFRTFTDVRLEGAGGDSTYGRGAMDVTLSHGLPRDFSAGLTLALGSTVGSVPPHRRWYLGGTQTVRGQSPDTAQSGNAFWLTRGEIGKDVRAFRGSVFGDLGWVGDRARMGDVGRPLSGVGVGLSVLDGMARIDLARGLYPRKQFRVDLSIGARW